jgi:hypothetical protein
MPEEGREAFEFALQRFEAGEFEDAVEAFRTVLARLGGADGPSSLYLRLAERFAREGVAPGWDGVITAESK